MKTAFGSIQVLERELSSVAAGVQGSGWASLFWDPLGKRLMAGGVLNHQVDVIPGAQPLLVIDVWEHAYYSQYEDRRTDWIAAYWKLVNWRAVELRFECLRIPDPTLGEEVHGNRPPHVGPASISDARARPGPSPHRNRDLS